MKISLIAALSENRVIGIKNTLPWHISSDLKRFKEVTKGHPVIMGRKTFESIKRLLPGRLNIIITRDVQAFLTTHPELDSSSAAGMTDFLVCNSLKEAIEQAEEYYVSSSKYQGEKKLNPDDLLNIKYKIHDSEHEVFIIGGGEIFKQAMPIADKLYLTVIHTELAGDAYFPDYSAFSTIVFQEEREEDGYTFTFLELEKP